jgi:hypothetical protein
MDQLANRYTRQYLQLLIVIIVDIVMLNSCAYKFTGRTYVAIEPWKEWQIQVRFKADSSFEMVDSFGCNRFDYVDNWRYNEANGERSLILKDSAKALYDKLHDAYFVRNSKMSKEQVIKSDRYFPIISSDTMVFIKNRVLRFRGLDFRVQDGAKDLNIERAKMIESYYVKTIGKRQYIEAFGGGKGLNEARKAIMNCEKIPVPMKLPSN